MTLAVAPATAEEGATGIFVLTLSSDLSATHQAAVIGAEKVGVDIVSVVGTECGGHPSMEEVGFIVLIPAAIDATHIPLIAGG